MATLNCILHPHHISLIRQPTPFNLSCTPSPTTSTPTSNTMRCLTQTPLCARLQRHRNQKWISPRRRDSWCHRQELYYSRMATEPSLDYKRRDYIEEWGASEWFEWDGTCWWYVLLNSLIFSLKTDEFNSPEQHTSNHLPSSQRNSKSKPWQTKAPVNFPEYYYMSDTLVHFKGLSPFRKRWMRMEWRLVWGTDFWE